LATEVVRVGRSESDRTGVERGETRLSVAAGVGKDDVKDVGARNNDSSDGKDKASAGRLKEGRSISSSGEPFSPMRGNVPFVTMRAPRLSGVKA